MVYYELFMRNFCEALRLLARGGAVTRGHAAPVF